MTRIIVKVTLSALVIATSLCWVAGHALSEKSSKPGETVEISGDYWALIIGITKYKNETKLPTARKDAEDVQKVLEERYGFRKDRIISLLDEEATREKIDESLESLVLNAGPRDSVFIYFAGHGKTNEPDKDRGWWVPHDGASKKISSLIPLVTVKDKIKAMKAKHVYIVVDSCFAGLLIETRTPLPIHDQHFGKLYEKNSRWALTSGKDEPVEDNGPEGHSIFAHHFLKNLKKNKHPYLKPSTICEDICRTVGINSDQQPQSGPMYKVGDEGGQFVFVLAEPLEPQKPQTVTVTLEEPSTELKQMHKELSLLREGQQLIFDNVLGLKTQIEGLLKETRSQTPESSYRIDGKSPAEFVKAQYGKSWAVVIGINDYRNAPRLMFSVNDASAVAEMLKNQGFNVTTLLNGSATGPGVLNALRDLVDRVGQNDRVVIYFSGLADKDPKANVGYLIPYDGKQEALAETGISTTDLQSISDKLPAKQALFVLDTMGIWPSHRSRGISHTRDDSILSLKLMSKRRARQVFSASGRGQFAIEDSESARGLFTHYLLRGLGSGLADSNGDHIITTSELFSYVSNRVTLSAAQKGVDQWPELFNLGSDSGELIFAYAESLTENKKPKTEQQ